jgi:hypothetical protein
LQIFEYDPQDEQLIQSRKWAITAGGYVRASVPVDGERFLHRILMKAEAGVEVDHIDRNPLNNRRSNLRLCSHQENQAARRFPKRDLPRGVYYDKRTGRYMAILVVDGRQRWLGRHDTPAQAKAARDAEAVRVWGEFAVVGGE